ncbi:MAG: hypothetical protein JXR73_14220 [Candidatus Omnitrophica bacterium]|nr:hypothetical protein [Candidatus Omnitrophota bacterium]
MSRFSSLFLFRSHNKTPARRRTLCDTDVPVYRIRMAAPPDCRIKPWRDQDGVDPAWNNPLEPTVFKSLRRDRGVNESERNDVEKSGSGSRERSFDDQRLFL